LRPLTISSSSVAAGGGASPGVGGVASAASRSAANTSRVATATPGLTSTAGSRGSVSGSGKTSPMPRQRPRGGSRQDGTAGAADRRGRRDASVVERDAVGARQQPQRGGGIGRAAAQTGRHRQPLGQ